MEKPKTTPKDFFVWLGAMVALYVSAISFIVLAHTYIEVWFPNELVIYGDPYSGPIRFAIASLVVMFPLFIWMMRIVHQDIRTTPEKKEVWVRRWLVFLTLFVSGLVMAIDVIMLVNSYLEGEMTTRFFLKAVVVLVVLAGTLLYFFEELRGTWERKPKVSIALGILVSGAVIVTIIASFFIIGSPESARLSKFDQQKISDLQTIQWQIVNYWQTKQKLPQTLEDLVDPIAGFVPPIDTQTGASYRYSVTGELSFTLCASFNTSSKDADRQSASQVQMPVIDPATENWIHVIGDTCFDRAIDPERYPPFQKSL